jgi:undecaprenyl-diphosphatase
MHSGPFTVVAVIISYVFEIPSLITFSLTIVVYLFHRNYKQYSALLLAAMSGDTIIVFIAKDLIHSPRPLTGLIYDTSFSFPSGHVAGAVVLCGLLTYIAWQIWKSPKAKTVSSALFITITSIVAFDRIYLNVHWFSDVLGGYLLGVFWLILSLLVFRYADKTRISAGDSEQNPPKCSAKLANQQTS